MLPLTCASCGGRCRPVGVADGRHPTLAPWRRGACCRADSLAAAGGVEDSLGVGHAEMHARIWFLFLESACTQRGSGELACTACCAGIRGPTGPSRPVNLILEGSGRILRMRFPGGAPASSLCIRLLTGPAVPSSSSKGFCPALRRTAVRRLEWGVAPPPPPQEAPAVASCRGRSPVPVHHCPRERQIGCRCAASLALSTSDAELLGAQAHRASHPLVKVLPTP